MPRILRSPRSKSFRLENVSVPNADGARCGRRRHPERTQSEVRLGSKIGPVIARIGRKYVSNRLEADAGLEELRTENDQPH